MQLNYQSGAGKLRPHQIVASYYCLAYDAVRAVLTERIGSDLYKEMVAASWAFVYTNAKNGRFPPERKPPVLLVDGSRPLTPFSQIGICGCAPFRRFLRFSPIVIFGKLQKSSSGQI